MQMTNHITQILMDISGLYAYMKPHRSLRNFLISKNYDYGSDALIACMSGMPPESTFLKWKKRKVIASSKAMEFRLIHVEGLERLFLQIFQWQCPSICEW